MLRVPHDEESRLDYEGWRVAAAAGFGVFLVALVVVTFPVLLKPLTVEFGHSREEVARAFGIAAATGALCAAPMGLLIDRVGARRVAVPSLIVFGCAFASLSRLRPDLAHLYVTFAVLGASGIGSSPIAYGRTIASWFAARRGLALAIVVAGGAAGGILHPPLAESLIARLGWREAWLVLGLAVVVLGAPVIAMLVRERPARSDGAAPVAGSGIATALRSRAFWLLAAAILAGTWLQNAVIVHLHALLTDRGVESVLAASALSAMAASALVGRLATGACLDRVGAGLVGAALLALAALGAFLLAGAQSFASVVAAACLIGLGTGGEADVVPYALSRCFGLRRLSALYGLTWIAGATGGALGPILMGRAHDVDGSYGACLRWTAGATLCAAASMLALRTGPTSKCTSAPPS